MISNIQETFSLCAEPLVKQPEKSTRILKWEIQAQLRQVFCDMLDYFYPETAPSIDVRSSSGWTNGQTSLYLWIKDEGRLPWKSVAESLDPLWAALKAVSPVTDESLKIVEIKYYPSDIIRAFHDISSGHPDLNAKVKPRLNFLVHMDERHTLPQGFNLH